MALSKRIPFPFDSESQAFDSSYNEAIAKRANEMRAKWMPAENVQAYRHGIHWQAHNASDPDSVSTMSQHAHEFMIKHIDIVEAKESVLDRLFHETANEINRSFRASLYAVISETCEKSGRVVSSSGRGAAASFLDMLKSVEFGVDKNGEPSLPEIHLGSEALKAMTEDLAKQGPSFHAEVERIKEEKIAEALLRERERFSKFKPAP